MMKRTTFFLGASIGTAMRRADTYKLFTTSIVVATLALGVAPSTGLAAPAKKDCSVTEAGTQADVYERLACRQQGLAEEMQTTAALFDETTSLGAKLTPAQLQQIKQGQAKADRAAKKNDARFFKRLAKAESRGNKQVGHLLPFEAKDDANLDGICDYEQEALEGYLTAECAAIELGDQGQLQACNPDKKNKGKGQGNGNPKLAGLECDRSIDVEEAASPAEESDMREAAEDLEATYEAAEENLIAMNTELVKVEPEVAEASTQQAFQAFRETGTDENTSVCPAPPASSSTLAKAAEVLLYLQAANNGAAAITGSITGQTVFGFNSQAITAVFDAIAMATDISAIVVDLQREAESDLYQTWMTGCLTSLSVAAGASGDGQDALVATIANLQTQITALNTAIGNLQNQVQFHDIDMKDGHEGIVSNDNTNSTAIKTNVEAARKEVVDLLRTPEGQRITGN